MLSRPMRAEVPTQSAINARLPGAYYYDCYEIAVIDMSRSALDYLLQSLAGTPSWVTFLMTVRNKAVRLAGLRDLGGLETLDAGKPAADYRPGDRVGIFTLISNTHAEALLGIEDSHLDVMLSAFVYSSGEAGKGRLAITTVVHVHNFLGRLYMLPVAPLHRIIAPAVLARAAG